MINTTKLAVLGMLYEKDMHGYDIKKHIEERMGDYTDIKFGSIYYFLSSFLEEGYVTETRPGETEDKRVYSITGKGKQLFKSLASDALHSAYEYIDPLGVLLNFIYIFPKEEIIESFRLKINDLEKLKRKALAERTRIMRLPGVTRFADYLFTHSLRHLNAEIEWMEDFISFVTVDTELFQ
ncbi:MAG: PadR family transcriptional regulator [Spirochaetia bacterium]